MDATIKSTVKVRGSLELVLKDAEGKVKKQELIDNLVVNVGLAHMIARCKDTAPDQMSHMAVGSGAVAPAAGDTTLGTEEARVAFDTFTIVTTTVANDTLQFVATFPAGTGTAALTEAGILNAASSGTLLSRVTFGAYNKEASDTLTITWKVVLS